MVLEVYPCSPWLEQEDPWSTGVRNKVRQCNKMVSQQETRGMNESVSGMVWYSVVWCHGVVGYGMVWYGVV